VQQARRWVDQGQQTLRQIKMVASWSAQILVYPIYAFFQTSRLLGNQVERSVEHWRSRLKQGESGEHPFQPQPLGLTSDVPLVKVLRTIQSLGIHSDLPIDTGIPEGYVRGIAMELESRSLILVTNHNQPLDILSLKEQQSLQQFMTWQVANYSRKARLWELTGFVAKRFGQILDAPVQTLLPEFTKSDGLLQTTWQRVQALLPGSPQANQPILQTLQQVKYRISGRDFLAQNLSEKKIPENVRLALNLTVEASSIVQAPDLNQIVIRGVASLLDQRTLVLVTNQNQMLDVLTLEQQHLVRQRITWEVANYLRDLKLKQRKQGLLPFRVPSEQSPVLLPVRFFYKLMAWMQWGTVAIATNLFQAASRFRAASRANLPLMASSQFFPISHQASPQKLSPFPFFQRPLLSPSLRPDLPFINLPFINLPFINREIAPIGQQELWSNLLKQLWQKLAPVLVPLTASLPLLGTHSAIVVAPPAGALQSVTKNQSSLTAQAPSLGLAQAMLQPIAQAVVKAIRSTGQLVHLSPKPSSNALNVHQPDFHPSNFSQGDPYQSLFSHLASNLPNAYLPIPYSPNQEIGNGLSRLDGSINSGTVVHHQVMASEVIRDGALCYESVANQETTRHQTAGNYIDTEAKLMGYEQSWLERIIRWLDLCLLWLEEWAIKLWNLLLNGIARFR
jgi:hypothetical protein